MNSNSHFIKAIHIFGRFHHPIDVLRTDFSARFFRRTDNTSARSSATGDLSDVNGGFPRHLLDLLTRFDFFFKISSSFIQNTPHYATLGSKHFRTLSISGKVFLFPTAQTTPKSAHSPIFQDTYLWNLIQLDFLSMGMRFVATDRELAGAKIVGEVSARRACRTSFFALLPIFPNASRRAQEEASFSALCLCKRQTFHSLFIKPQS